MALIKFGAGVVQMAGKIAGTVFARNRYGSYARAGTKPTNPNTEAQSQVRAIIGTLNSYWQSTLTEAQRIAWGAYANNVPMVNRLGETQNFSGYNHFCRTNAARLNAGLTVLEDAPTTYSLGEQDPTFDVVADVSDNKIKPAFDNTMAWAHENGGYLLIYQGQPCAATRNYFGGPFRYIGKIAGSSTTPPTSPGSLDPYFTLVEGHKQFVQARILRADGRLSSPFRCDTLTIAGA